LLKCQDNYNSIQFFILCAASTAKRPITESTKYTFNNNNNNNNNGDEISGSHGGECDDDSLLGHGAM
jgi:hypothetical protein